ncbi:MAG: hypothetical protein ABIP06_11300 [Pyrinomonadaceae bacterium]
MKRFMFFLLLLGVIGFSSGSAFAQCERSRLSQIQCGYYNEGYEDGVNDARTNRENNYRRYRNKLDSQLYETYYTQGYDAGYSGINSSPNPGPFQLPRPNRPGRGTATGTVDWSGRVDNRVNIVIRGNDITNQQVAGSFNPGYQNMSGVLPRRNSIVSVSKLSGRGTAFVTQQPDRNNDYTAIVQVSDPQRSDDDYRLQIRWQSQGGNSEDRDSRGNVTWRGRVDQTANIYISGSEVDSIDESGSGLRNVNFNINGYLAARNGNVSVKKRRGRGTVTVLQQPGAGNNYEAIVQVFDPDGGDDEYELEINW